jgi:TonB family protein
VRLARLAVFTVALTVALASPLLAAAYQPQKGTEILWDKYGVPHLYAKSTPDLFFLYGYVQAEAHGDLLLRIYGESRGRAAEYFNAATKADTDANIKSDTWVWTNSIPQRSEEWLKAQTPEFRGYLEAFAAGINAYAAKHPEALTEDVKRVLPITALDPIEHSMHFVHYTFMASIRLADPTPARGAAPPADASLTQPKQSNSVLASTSALATNSAIATELSSFAAGGGPASFDTAPDDDGGSNAWAIAPSHSTSGHSMLLSNPHLAWAGQQSYFEAEFNAPGIHIYGATQVGLPTLRFAFNDNLGYTHTVNGLNGKTLYRIKTAPLPNGKPGYLFDGKVLPFETSEHTLKVRQPNGTFTTQTLNIRSTIHGPIIKEEDGDPIALRVAALDKPFMLEQYWQMSTAHNFTEFETAIKRLQPPTYNIIYADRDGHIEYLFGGDMPHHDSGDFAYWSGIVPGDTSETLWHDYLTYEELPKAIDPPTGYVQNTNDPPWNAAWPNSLDPKKFAPYVAAQTGTTFRSERSLHMVSNFDSGPESGLTAIGTNDTAGDSAPQIISEVQPQMTDAATKANVSGVVLVHLMVDTHGLPMHVQVLRSSVPGFGLDEKAVQAVHQYKFKPATKDGVPVSGQLDVEVSFGTAKDASYKPKPFSFDQLIQKKLSTRVEMADRILPDLLKATDQYGTPQAKEAAAILAKWDRLDEADSKGAVLFYAWARQFMGPSMASQTGFAVPYTLSDPMHTPGGLKDPAKAAAQLDAAATETIKDFGSLDVPWGKVMRFQINNQSDGSTNHPRSAPIDNVDLPGNGGYGNTGVFRVITFGALDPATKTRTPVHGDGYVALIEFTTPVHAMMSLSYGDSSQPNSPFHTNQLPLLEDKKMRPALLTHKDVEANLSSKETF